MLTSLAIATQPVAASAASGGGPVFGLRPAMGGLTTLDHGHFAYALPPAAHIADTMQAVNLSANTITLDMYAANLVVTASALSPGQAGDPPKGATSWIRLARSTMVIPATGEAPDPFTVTIPAKTPPGDYFAAVVASLAGTQRTADGLSVQTRVALIVKVTVTGAVHPSLAAGALTHHRRGGAEQFSIDVVNRGNVVLDVGGTLDLPGNQNVTFDPRGLYVIPGGRATLTAEWRNLPMLSDSQLTARLVATLNDHQVATITRTTTIRFVPWVLFIVAAGSAALLFVVPVLGRSRLRAWRLRRREERAVIAAYRARGSTPGPV